MQLTLDREFQIKSIGLEPLHWATAKIGFAKYTIISILMNMYICFRARKIRYLF